MTELHNSPEGDPAIEAWARSRVEEMVHEAKNIARMLGLPQEKELQVLKILYPPKSGAESERNTSPKGE